MAISRTSPALTSRSSTTVARVARTSGLSRLGWVTATSAAWWSKGVCRPGLGEAGKDMIDLTIQSPAVSMGMVATAAEDAAGGPVGPSRAGVVELVDTPALGAGGRKPLEVRVLSPALTGKAWRRADRVCRCSARPARSRDAELAADAACGRRLDLLVAWHRRPLTGRRVLLRSRD